MSLTLAKGAGIELRRRRQTFHATNVGDFVSTTSSQIRIEINIDKEVMDFDTGYLMFDMLLTKDGGTTDTIEGQPWSASSWIRDVRIYDRAGREIGEQIRQYNGMARKMYELLGNDGANANYLDVLEGASGIAASGTGANAATTSVEFAHKLLTHIFDIKSYFPAQKLGGLILELDMEDVGNVALMNGTTDAPASYTISNVRYVVDLVLLKSDAESSLNSQISSGGLEIHYESPMNSSQPITTSTNQRFDLGVANGHVKSIQAFQVLDTARNAVDEDFWASFSQNTLTSYRMRLGSEYLTEKDVKISATRLSEYLVEYLKSENLESHDMATLYGDSALVLANFFTIGQKVEVNHNASVLSKAMLVY